MWPAAVGPRPLRRIPALAVATHLALVRELRQDAIEVVRLDSHVTGELGDRDAGSRSHQFHRLSRAGVVALAATARAATATGAVRGRCGNASPRRLGDRARRAHVV